MSTKTGRKIGFWTALAMLVGSVVGIGIFFKNYSVFNEVEGDGMTALFAWILGGVLALTAAISFTEIGSFKTQKIHGISAWAEKTAGGKFGYFVRFNFAFFYCNLLPIIIGVFSSEMLFRFLQSTEVIDKVPEIWVHVLLGTATAISFQVISYFSVKTSGIIQLGTTLIKWIPLVATIIIGISFATTNNVTTPQGEFFGMLGDNRFKNPNFQFTNMIAALPAILFAYDAFLGVGSISNKTKGGSKTISAVVLIGMISIVILYTLISVSSGLHHGLISGILADSLPASAVKPITITVWLLITISAFGVTNGMSTVSMNVLLQAYETNTFFGTRMLKKRFKESKGYAIFYLVMQVIAFLIVCLPALLLKSDKYVDGLSNFPTLFFFGIYALIIFFYMKNRKSYETRKLNNVLIKTSAWVAIIGIGYLIGYLFFYEYTTKMWNNPNEIVGAWGLFSSSNDAILITNIWKSILFIIALSVFVGVPALNKVLVKRFEYYDVTQEFQK